ncbi:MAG: hypothetical protein AB7S26_34600 [Sandaracinaceae bacterium]
MSARTSLALSIVLALACGSPQPADRATTPGDSRGAGDARDDEPSPDRGPSDREAVDDDPASSDGEASDDEVAREGAPTGCAGRAYPECTRDQGCVWDGACRDPLDTCELVVPASQWSGQPVFDRGDPCESVRPDCAWSTARGACAPFVAVSACPRSLQDAQSLQVECDHSGQAPLRCAYGRTRCSCVRPHYCGGAPPPPTIENPPATFTCVPPFDDRGCPTGNVRAGASCRADPELVCTSCATSAQCVNGHWRVRRLPPRP